ncbi:MAG: T9SS type A sorting domain-containing protein, partial [Ferruginibacter sp.]
KLKLNVFPNPAKDVTAVTISVLQGKFVGKYKISLFDLAGKLIQAKDMQLNLVNTFTYNFGTIAAGKYLIKVANADGTETSLLKFQKL